MRTSSSHKINSRLYVITCLKPDPNTRKTILYVLRSGLKDLISHNLKVVGDLGGARFWF